MKVVVTALCRPQDGLAVYFPGRLYDVDPAIGQRIIDGECGEEATKSSLEKKNKGELFALASSTGQELEGSESKSKLASIIVDEAPEVEAPAEPSASPPPPGGGGVRREGGPGGAGAV